MAFACRPSVIVLDEPTTGLDVSTQAHVLATVRDLTRAPRRRRAVRHPRPRRRRQPRRPCRRDVRRAHRRAGPDVGDLRARRQHPYTRYLTAAAPDIRVDQPIVGLPGRAPVARQAPGRLRVRVALRARHRRVPRQPSRRSPRLSPAHTVRCFRRRHGAGAHAHAGRRRLARRRRPTRRCRCAGSTLATACHDGGARRQPRRRPRRVRGAGR